MWVWLTVLTRTHNDEDGYQVTAERRAKVTRAEMTRLFANELSDKRIRR